VIYRQFSATIVSAMSLSVLVAIVLTPALCATDAEAGAQGRAPRRDGFLRWFNRAFERGGTSYQNGVRGILARSGRFMLVFAALAGLMVCCSPRLPSAFLPRKTRETLLAQMIAPVGATQQRTLQSLEKVEQHFLEGEKGAVKAVFGVQGFSFGGTGQNNGMAWINLKDWSERKAPELHADAVAGRRDGETVADQGRFVFAFVPPPIPELGLSAASLFS